MAITFDQIIVDVIVAAGLIFLLFGLFKINQMLGKFGEGKIRAYWNFLNYFTLFFILLYFVFIIFLHSGLPTLLDEVAGIMLFVSGLFILVSVWFEIKTLNRLIGIRTEVMEKLRKADETNKKLEEKAKSLAEANVNISELYANLEGAQMKLEETDKILTKKNEDLSRLNASLAQSNVNMSELYVELDEANQSIQKEKETAETAYKEISRMNYIARVVNASLNINEILGKIAMVFTEVFRFEIIGVHLVDTDNRKLKQDRLYGPEITQELEDKFKAVNIALDDDCLLTQVIRQKKIIQREHTPDAAKLNEKDRALYDILPYKSVIFFPLEIQNKLFGVVDFYSMNEEFSIPDEKMPMLKNYITQVATAINNARTYNELKHTKMTLAETQKTVAMTKIFRKFVPQQFLNKIAKEGFESIKLGYSEYTKLSIMFADLRDFTSLTEVIHGEQLYNVLNNFLKLMSEEIYKRNGFIDKFIGDGIMALFGIVEREQCDIDEIEACSRMGAEAALQAAIAMQTALIELNKQNKKLGISLSCGIGVETGEVILGTIGSEERMDSTVLGNSVNAASRLERLTRVYDADILFSGNTLSMLNKPEMFSYRELGLVEIRGKRLFVRIYECFDHENDEIKALKTKTKPYFGAGCNYLENKKYSEALEQFEKALSVYPDDKIGKNIVKIVRQQEQLETCVVPPASSEKRA